MFTGIAAVVAGTANAALVALAVAEVGMVLTAVGAVTGSKTLMKIGGVLGLVGGVGSLVAGAAGAGAAGAAGEAAIAEGATEASIAAQSAAEVGGPAALSSTESSILGQSIAEQGAFEASFNPSSLAIETATASPVTTLPVTQSTVVPGQIPPPSDVNLMADVGMPSQSATAEAAQSASENVSFGEDFFNQDFMPSTAETAQTNIAKPTQTFETAGKGVSAPRSPADQLPIDGPGYTDTQLSILEQSNLGRAQSSGSLFKNGLTDFWKSLDSKGKNDLLKLISQIPGGIQESQNADRNYELQKRALEMRSYGSSLPIGIVRGARVG